MKKITAIIAMFIIIFSCYGPAYAAGVSAKTDQAILTAPKSERMTTKNSSVVLAGKGSEDDRVTIELYTKKNSTFSDLQQEIRFQLVNMGTFTKEIDLYPGENKIVVTLRGRDIFLTETRYITLDSGINLADLIKDLSFKNSIIKINTP